MIKWLREWLNAPGPLAAILNFKAWPPFKVGDRVRFGDDPTVYVQGADGAFRPEQGKR